MTVQREVEISEAEGTAERWEEHGDGEGGLPRGGGI